MFAPTNGWRCSSRGRFEEREKGHEELPGSGHPVAEGVRTGRVLPGLPGLRGAEAFRARPAERRAAAEQDLGDGVLPAEHANAACHRGGDAPAWRTCVRV